jgi:hypothetical protein
MLNSTPALGRILALCMSAVVFACGAPPAAKAAAAPASAAPASEPAPAPVSTAPAPEAAPVAEVKESPGFDAALASLRVSGTENALQGLTTAPTDAEAYARAALAYAPTDVPGMTMLWGLSYQAMGGGSSDAAVAKAFAKVLTERISAKLDEETKQVSFNLRLAPGQMPVRQAADGSVNAPIAHAFEALFSPAVTGFRPPWTIEQFYDVLSTWVGAIALHGTALDEKVPLNGWLVTLAKAGHLEAFCYQLLGPAFPAELKTYKAANAPALKAYRDFVKGAPLRPANAAMPDDLVRIK